MPIEFFNREVLIHMGNQIGTTTKVDEATASVLHGRFGRFYVEIDVNKPLIPCVRLMGRVQRVEYEGLHVEEATSSPPHPMVTVVDSSMQDDIDMDGVPNNLQTLVDH
ncbi:hypothetical protein M9H77_36243 [Catharanthus roseus]|uniref:Uncharacterized protein n=1 Tax=Catharanthus roseus TaxID=4058 RepID=A0ACB9ZRM4_CATRO|nr:hypothetical protein M9H77_36243 [Catharanthus roseus]